MSNIDGALVEFRKRRMNHESARKYTIVHNGELRNAGFFRDNILDILEELSDVHNIAGILWRRLNEGPLVPGMDEALDGVMRLAQDSDALARRAYMLRARLPNGYAEDQHHVLGDATPNRIVTLDEVGL